MRSLITGGVVATTLALMLVLPALAAELTSPCSMEIRSFDGPDPTTSAEVDSAEVAGTIPAGDVGSQSRPFKVDPEGSIDFAIHTITIVFHNTHFDIHAQSMPVPIL